ncbi:hypothetical protein TNCV_1946011 [Trichonephila clavipes]|uniref:Uncharacterized protein n=1 Tax=Trichonephila clavipes TaxID=2585209 RepID=A0A8X6SKG3_TRICX|nr:hypothetical protein TNCV_1946011 [Trichonephila clavipes]
MPPLKFAAPGSGPVCPALEPALVIKTTTRSRLVELTTALHGIPNVLDMSRIFSVAKDIRVMRSLTEGTGVSK